MDVDLMVTSAFFLVLENLSNTKGDLHFIQTKSGHLQLIYEPYIFVTDSVRSGRTFWRCMEYGKRCRARITSKNNVLRITNPVHNHTDNHMQKIARKYELGEVVTCPSVWGLLCSVGIACCNTTGLGSYTQNSSLLFRLWFQGWKVSWVQC